MDAEEAVETLLEGNNRFMEGASVHPNSGRDRRREVLGGQSPIAAILSCSDSRVPPEMVFDAGIGDIFVVRTAGNVVDEVALGSIEYAVDDLHVPLVVVMGHTFCGAVKAAVEGAEPRGSIASVIRALAPSVEAARQRGEAVVHHAVIENVRRTVASLVDRSSILRDAAASKRAAMIGAVYDMETGAVLMFD
ncbi:MAG: carbonic anhydrase [Thermoplasmata archaeon]|nr:carbonic anhydrase [Thermoplasmata archaeon]